MKSFTRLEMLTVLSLVGLLVISGSALAGKKSEGFGSFVLTGPSTPNPARCGPVAVEVKAAGQGVNTAYGLFDVEQSFCLDASAIPAYWEIFDFEATQTFVVSGDKLFISLEEWREIIDLTLCMGTPEDGKVDGKVTGGTGNLSGAHGKIKMSYGAPQFSFCPTMQGRSYHFGYKLDVDEDAD
jgi:hypothetical protein